jgi:fucose permease
MAAECFGLAALSRVLGIIIMSDAVGEALMPYLVAYFRDSTGSYAGGFAFATGLAMLGAVAILSIKYRNGVPVSRLQLEAQTTIAIGD